MLAYGGSVILFVMTVSIYDDRYVTRPFVEFTSLLIMTVSTEEGILPSHIVYRMTCCISIHHILVICFIA